MTRSISPLACVAITALLALGMFATTNVLAARPVSIDGAVQLVEQEVTSDDGAAGDSFSYSVTIAGDVAVVGAPDAMVSGTGAAGAAYVFTRGSDGAWTQAQKLVADDGADGDGFGFSVSLSGDRVLIGAPYATIGANGGQGTAYVFTESGGSWTQTQKLVSSDGGASNNFGWSVSLSGTRALISSPVAAVGGNILQGKAYIFEDDGVGMLTEGPILVADDATAQMTFGYSVSLDGDTALIGAQGTNAYFGAAYVFENSGGTWSQTGELVPDDGTTLEFFGISVAVSGDTALVGAYYQNVDPNMHQGSAYVFRKSGGIWSQSQKLTASDGAANDRFGLSVALRDGEAAVGAYYAAVDGQAHQGAAYLFSDDGSMFIETGKLTASDGVAEDNFGNSVAVDAGTALIGAFNASPDGHAAQGAAYFYAPPADDTIFSDGFDSVP